MDVLVNNLSECTISLIHSVSSHLIGSLIPETQLHTKPENMSLFSQINTLYYDLVTNYYSLEIKKKSTN